MSPTANGSALALRERNEALEAAEGMRGAVLDQISHQLRTPLNTIFGFGQFIADTRFGELTKVQRGYAEKILESARHLLATVDDATELAALEIDSLHDHGSELSLGDTLMLTGRLLEKRATEEGVALQIVTTGERRRAGLRRGAVAPDRFQHDHRRNQPLPRRRLRRIGCQRRCGWWGRYLYP